MGRRTKVGDVHSTRAHVYTLEQAVTASLENSKGRVGKFNVIVDGTGFSFGLMPSLHYIKVLVTILQDHFPDRLGLIVLSNIGRVGEMVVSMVKPLISEEVRQKIVVLPHKESKRKQVLETVVGVEYIPKWMGGEDDYEFSTETYYSNPEAVITDEEALEYTKTMPYHA